jgi:hypothetical protein
VPANDDPVDAAIFYTVTMPGHSQPGRLEVAIARAGQVAAKFLARAPAPGQGLPAHQTKRPG